MLRGALTMPTRSSDAAGVFIIGTVLTAVTWTIVPIWIVASVFAPVAIVLAPVALAPWFVTRGYYVRVVAEAARDGADAGAPSFVGWGRLYRDGVASTLLSACLLLPLVVFAALGVAAGWFVGLGHVDPGPIVDGAVSNAVGDGTAVETVLGVLGGFVGVVTLGYLVVFAYLRPAALALFADTGRLRDGLHPGRIGRVATSGDYAAGWVLAFGTVLTGYVLAAPFVPLVVGIGVVFATRIVIHSLYGMGAARAVGEGVSDGSSTEAGMGADETVDIPDGSELRSDTDVSAPMSRSSEAPADVQVGRSLTDVGEEVLTMIATLEDGDGSNDPQNTLQPLGPSTDHAPDAGGEVDNDVDFDRDDVYDDSDDDGVDPDRDDEDNDGFDWDTPVQRE